MSTVVFSHGFGVRADARGMFTEIVDSLPNHTCVLFDYNTILANGDIEVAPLSEQAKKLQQKIDEQTDDNLVIIAHSQGCITAGLVDLRRVSKVILLAPPVHLSMQHVIDKLMKKPGAIIDLDATSQLPRRDGTTTHISKEYIESVNNINPLDLYATIAETTNTTVVRCTNDEVLGLTNVHNVPHAKHIDLDATHDFSGTARKQLLELIAQEI